MIFNEITLMENIQKLNLSNQMKIISKPFNTNGFIIMVIILTIYKILSPKEFILIWAGAMFALLLKLLYRRQRPYHFSNTIINYTDKEHTKITDIYSFPSGHTFSATLFCLILLSKYPHEFVFNIIAILVGFSRIFLGVHYPSDIIGGIVFAFIFYKIAS
jgi:undecaprenyl-diphosphatase